MNFSPRPDCLAKRIAIGACVIFAIVAGCAAPKPAPTNAPGKPAAGGMFIDPLAQLDSAQLPPWQQPWYPVQGRAEGDVFKRHLPAQTDWPVLAESSFKNGIGQSWSRHGPIGDAPLKVNGHLGVELRAPSQARFDLGGIELDLDTIHLAGKDVRLEFELACTSQPQVQALEGVSISVRAADLAGEQRAISLPILADVSPGWEVHTYYLHFDPALALAKLRIDLTQPLARLAIRSVTMREVPDSPVTMAGSPAPVNLIVDGDFETHQPRFFASQTRTWPSGDRVTVPAFWEYSDQATLGRSSLLLHQDQNFARIGFGSLDLTRTARKTEQRLIWHLNFFARSSEPAIITATLRTRYRRLGQHQFRSSVNWERHLHTFTIEPQSLAERRELERAELLFDFNTGQNPQVDHWLDGIALTHAPLSSGESQYVRSAHVEVGIEGPTSETYDLRQLVSTGESARLTVRVVPDPTFQGQLAATSQPAGEAASLPVRLALDVVDSCDRLVWTSTKSLELSPSEVFTDSIALPLPRGYYRVMATVWRGMSPEAERLAHAQLPLAVIDMADSVPKLNRFGLTAADGNVSLHTTHLGAGWLRMDLSAQRVQSKRSQWDFTLWRKLMERSVTGGFQIVSGVTLPQESRDFSPYVREWLGREEPAPVALVVSPPAVSASPVAEYFSELTQIDDILRDLNRDVQLIRDLSVTGLDSDDSTELRHMLAWQTVGLSCVPTALPEYTEPLLQRIAGASVQAEQIWDLSVPVRLGSSASDRDLPLSSAGPLKLEPVQQLQTPIDPVQSASRMIRGILIRGLASSGYVCAAAKPLEPRRSAFQPDEQVLHEFDLAPRPALAAFEWMTSLLNRAELRRWIDFPGGCRMLTYVTDDAQTVMAVWRPFGLQPTELKMSALPDNAQLYNLFGRSEEIVSRAGHTYFDVNEMVQYIVIPASEVSAINALLDSATVNFAIPASQPASSQPS